MHAVLTNDSRLPTAWHVGIRNLSERVTWVASCLCGQSLKCSTAGWILGGWGRGAEGLTRGKKEFVDDV